MIYKNSKGIARYNSISGFAHLFLIVVIVVIGISGLLYYSWQKGLTKTSPNQEVLPIPTSNINESATWKAYDGKYFSFNYPPSWIILTKREKCNYLEEVIMEGAQEIYKFKVEVVGFNYVTNESFPPQNWTETSVNVVNRIGVHYEFINVGGGSFITIALMDDNPVNYIISVDIIDRENAKSLVEKVLTTFTFKDEVVYEEDKELILIDKWIKENNLNSVGDPKNTLYAGGALYNELTGETMCRYEYIVQRNPDKPWTL